MGSVEVEGMLCKVATCSLHAIPCCVSTGKGGGGGGGGAERAGAIYILHQYVQYVRKFSV